MKDWKKSEYLILYFVWFLTFVMAATGEFVGASWALATAMSHQRTINLKGWLELKGVNWNGNSQEN